MLITSDASGIDRESPIVLIFHESGYFLSKYNQLEEQFALERGSCSQYD